MKDVNVVAELSDILFCVRIFLLFFILCLRVASHTSDLLAATILFAFCSVSIPAHVMTHIL